MSVWIDFDYLSVGNKISQDEINLVQKKGRVTPEVATGIVRIGAELRRQYKANEIPYGPSVGDLVNWATLSADGVTPQNAAEETIIAMTSDNLEIQDTVRRVVNMVFSNSSDSQSPDNNISLDSSQKENSSEEDSEAVTNTQSRATSGFGQDEEYKSEDY